jgi:hypothetical protein
MGTRLEDLLRTARESGARYVPSMPGEALNRLLDAFREETRILWKLEPHVVMAETVTLAVRRHGAPERVCFVLVDGRRGRRVAVDLIPEKLDERLASRERMHAILAGGDVDAIVVFRGKDVVRNPSDCLCLLARLEHGFFSDVGFEHARTAANPRTRSYELHRNGTTFVPVPWTTAEGEDAVRYVRVTRRVRKFPRRLAA